MSADNNLVKHASHCAMKSTEITSSCIVAEVKQKRGSIAVRVYPGISPGHVRDLNLHGALHRVQVAPEKTEALEFSLPLALSAVLHPSAYCDETLLSVRNCSLQQLLSCIWLTEASDGLRPFAVFASTTRPCPRTA